MEQGCMLLLGQDGHETTPERREESTRGNQLHVNPASCVWPDSYLVTDLNGRYSSKMQLMSRKHLTILVSTYKDVSWGVLTYPWKTYSCLKYRLRVNMGKPNLVCEDYRAREMHKLMSSLWRCCYSYVHFPSYFSSPGFWTDFHTHSLCHLHPTLLFFF